MNYSNRSYQIVPSGSGKIAAALAQKCAQGEIGESLVRNGITQASFCLFLCRFAQALFTKTDKREAKTPEQAANSFLLVSGGNASAAQKALGQCELHWEIIDENGESVLDKDGNPQFDSKKPMLVETLWAQGAGKGSSITLADLD